MVTRIISVGLFLATLVAFINTSHAQSKQFQHFTSSDGLSQSEIYAFLEDAQGFMWIGTVDGLNRYDGYDVTNFHTDKDNPHSISNNTIRCLAEDASGRIWIGTDDGLSVYDTEMEKIHQIPLSEYNKGRLTINAAVIVQERLYLGTSQGLLAVNVASVNLKELDQHTMLIQMEDQNAPYAIVACEVGQDGLLWVTTSTGLYKLDVQANPNNFSLKNELDLSEILPDIRNIEQDDLGNLWIVSHDNGFLRYNPKTKEILQFNRSFSNSNISSNKISSVTTDKKGDLWIGTHDKGLMFLEKKFLGDYNPIFQIIEHDPYNDRSLSSNLVYSLFVSKSNLLWIGTIGSGINIYDPNRKPFNYYNLHNPSDPSSYNTNFIRAVYADRKNDIWIGTHNNGLFHFNRGSLTKFEKIGFGSESIFHLNDAGGGNTLVCSGKGISLVRKDNASAAILSALDFGPSFYVTQPVDGIFWVASLNGLKKCKLSSNTISLERVYNTQTSPAISFDNCRVVILGKDKNELYVGTEGGGLNILQLDTEGNPVQSKKYEMGDSTTHLSNNYIRSIIETQDNDIWIGTYEGLNRLLRDANGNISFKSYVRQDGLPNHTIQSIAEDDDGNLWIGTNNGLCKFDPETELFTQYTSNDGIQSDEFSEHTIYKNVNNEIIIGGINGINTFSADEIVSSDFEPNTTLTDFYLFNNKIGVDSEISEGNRSPLVKSISLTDSIYLEPNQNSIGFDFSAMTFGSPEKVQYAYMLEGFEESWNITDASDRKANYTNLGYGDYVFRVKATNNDGIWEETPKAVFISIDTPFYLTTIAFLLYGLLAIVAFVFFTNYSILRYTTKNKIILENLHNKKVRELEELRTRFFINVSHDLRTPLTLISSPLDVILKKKGMPSEVNNLLQLIHRNVGRLKDMTEQLLDISKVEGGTLRPKFQNIDIVPFIQNEVSFFENAFSSKGIDLEVKSDILDYTICLDSDMISKVMFNMLSNALKHTVAGKVVVHISKIAGDSIADLTDAEHDHYLKIAIQDSGEGINQGDLERVFDRFYQGKDQNKKGYGVGLSHSKDLILAHNGKVSVTSEKGVGSTFCFYLPAIQVDVDVEKEVLPVLKSNPTTPTETESIIEEVNEDNLVGTHKMRVLLVEDNPDLRQFIRSELSKVYEILEAEDGEQGLAIAKSEFPDLIVSDVMMPNMDGMEFCKEIKSNIKTSHIPVILLTAKVDKEAKYQGLEIGADDYISKPFEMDYLLLRIRNLLQNRDRLRQMFQGNIRLEPSKVTVTSIDEEFLSNLMTEIEKGISDANFSITALERELGMSHSVFYNKIKSLTGQSAKDLVVSVRMKRAKQVLEDTANIRVSEVAYMVGFTDPKYFSKRFKEYFDMAPSEVLKK